MSSATDAHAKWSQPALRKTHVRLFYRTSCSTKQACHKPDFDFRAKGFQKEALTRQCDTAKASCKSLTLESWSVGLRKSLHYFSHGSAKQATSERNQLESSDRSLPFQKIKAISCISYRSSEFLFAPFLKLGMWKGRQVSPAGAWKDLQLDTFGITNTDGAWVCLCDPELMELLQSTWLAKVSALTSNMQTAPRHRKLFPKEVPLEEHLGLAALARPRVCVLVYFSSSRLNSRDVAFQGVGHFFGSGCWQPCRAPQMPMQSDHNRHWGKHM